MPKTTMNEDHFTPRAKYNVRLAGQFAPVKPIPVSQSMQQATNLHLGLRVLLWDTGHDPGSLFWTYRIGQR